MKPPRSGASTGKMQGLESPVELVGKPQYISSRNLPVSRPVQCSVRVPVFNHVARVLSTLAPIFSCPSRSRPNKANAASCGIMRYIPERKQLGVPHNTSFYRGRWHNIPNCVIDHVDIFGYNVPFIVRPNHSINIPVRGVYGAQMDGQ